MALYVPAGARRRRIILALIGGLVVGLVIGYVVGRATSPGLSDDVAEVQGLALDASTALQRIPIEYEQSLAGEGGESTDTIIGAIDRAHGQLDDAYAGAVWLADDASATTDASFEALLALVDDEASTVEFERATEALVAQIETTFAITAEAAG